MNNPALKFEPISPRDKQEIVDVAQKVYDLMRGMKCPQNAANALAWVQARIINESQTQPGEPTARDAVAQIGAIVMLYWAKESGRDLTS